MTRHHLAVCGLLLLVFLAGCSGFGQATSEEGLAEDAEYDWDTTVDAMIDIEGDRYTAVYNVTDRSTVRLYHSTVYGDDRPIAVRAVQFRHTDGTVVNATELEIEETRSEVIVELPADEGQLAFTAPTRPKRFSTATFVEGSYEVAIPENHSVDNFFLATVRPGGYETTTVDDRVHITWESVTSRSVRVHYYLERDLYLFGGLVGVAAIAGVIGIGYVWRQVKELRRKREELGLDVDIEDDSRRPPPGMR